MAYTKLFNSIVTSTIWSEDDQTRIVWITMLAIADKNGEVQGSVPGLARIAGVPVEACRLAIGKFMSPDLDSRTKDDEGRRIEEIDGGWHLLNHRKYREMASDADRAEKAALRQSRHRAKVKRNKVTPESRNSHAPVTPESRQIPHAEADANSDSDSDSDSKIRTKNKEESASLPFSSLEFSKAWKDWTNHRKEIKKPLTPTQITKQLEELQTIGEQRAIAMINHTITKGWQGLREPESILGTAPDHPRRAEFLAIFTECYHAFTDKAYPLGDNDMESLSSLLSALPDLTAETWREALEWCQDTAQKEGRYAPKIIATGNLAAFCSNWSGIVAYSQTYQEPKK